MDLLNIQKNTTVLTPNRRLSAAFLKKYNTEQIAQGKLTWQSLDILPFTSWINRLWRDWSMHYSSPYLPLSTQQEQVLWEDILTNSPENDYLLQISNTADIAKSAWSILKQWEVDIHDPVFLGTEDSIAFQKWAKQFAEIARAKQWIDADSLVEVLLAKIKNQEIRLPEQLILLGFTEISPLHQHFFATCQAAGTKVSATHQMMAVRHQQRIALSDEETEIRTMAKWAKAVHDQDKQAVIGCVVPHLDTLRDKIVTLFSAVFADENTFTLHPHTLPFNISAGKKLQEYPIIHAALQFLNLQIDKISMPVFSNLLRSPFLGAAEQEMLARAQFDSFLKRRNMNSCSLATLLADDGELNLKRTCPELAKQLRAYLTLRAEIQTDLPLHTWTMHFMNLLSALGWPGERSLISQEYQIVQAWLELMHGLTAFDTVLSPLNYHKALHYLTRLATKTIYQPQSPEAPVQILGLLEAAGMPLTHLWVMGLDDSAWPPAPKPNPFIPPHLQKKLQMPHATAERELQYCQKLMTQIQQSAEHIIFSHALKNQDAGLRPSALLKEIPEITLEQLTQSASTPPAVVIYESRAIETIMDEQGPAISDFALIRGGVNIFKQQAACPFKAFAEYRLHTRTLESPTLGLRPQDRGEIIHHALDLIWQELGDHQTLVLCDEHFLQDLIQQSVEQAILKVTTKKVSQLRYLSLELQRLKKLLRDWLLLEKARPAFKVAAREQEKNITIGNISLVIRVDRIDELPNGKQIIIDYKTGKHQHIKSWFSARPDDPQLPLYCITHPEKTLGISFAQIHPENMVFSGVSSDQIEMQSMKVLPEVHYTAAETWNEQVASWQTVLTQLADDFCAGNAKVDPKEVETCHYCHLQALCRIYEN